MLGRRDSKPCINFRDDLSEYSSPSSWGDGPGPLSLADHRLASEGLQARRTVGEALLRAQWERQVDADAEACTEACKCFGSRAARFCLEALRRTPSRPSVVFTWAEVQSVILLPYAERGPFLIAISTFKREDGSREWLLQAASVRSRARWAIEMVTALLRDRAGAVSPTSPGFNPSKCCGPGTSSRLSTAFFMDMMRIAWEVARQQPSAEGMRRLVEALELLVEGGGPAGQGGAGSGGDGSGSQPLAAPHFPFAALRRFGEAVRRAHADFEEWRTWREIAQLVRPPQGWDEALWRGRVLPCLWPNEPSLRDMDATRYPAVVDSQLSNAADRCRRTLS